MLALEWFSVSSGLLLVISDENNDKLTRELSPPIFIDSVFVCVCVCKVGVVSYKRAKVKHKHSSSQLTVCLGGQR